MSIHKYIMPLSLLTFMLFLGSRDMHGQDCYELVWNDEFNSDGLPDSSKWSYETGGGGWGNNELQYYTASRAENAKVENGRLMITAREENFLSNQYTSARLITYPNGHSWEYGKIEARMKLPQGQGIWPAFWMLGDSFFEGTGWPACGEIDIMEMIGGGDGRDNVIHGTVHWSDVSDNHAQYGGPYELEAGIFADEFHIFSVEWTASTIKWFMDGEQYHEIDLTPGHLSEFRQSFFMILNVAVGGDWPGNPNASTEFPQTLEVDYVRVYQLDQAPEIIGSTEVVKAAKNVRYSTVESGDFTYQWTVPDDAEIIEGQGTHSIWVDWGCAAGNVSCQLETQCDTHSLERPVSIKEMEIQGQTVVEAMDTNLTYEVPLTHEASYDWTVPDGVTFHQPDVDTNVVFLNWHDADGEINVDVSDFCGTDSASLTVLISRQLPYPGDPHIIPGTIESVHYDYGGEGIAYHDTEPENQGTGSRQDEGVDTEPNDGGENVGWIEPGEWLEYTVSVEETNTYDIELRVASLEGGGQMTILFNGGNRTQTIDIPQTGDWTVFTSIYVRDVQINTTDTLMRVEFQSGQFNLGRMRFADEITNTGMETIPEYQIDVYPSVTRGYIYFSSEKPVRQCQVMDRYGRTVMSKGQVASGEPVDVSALPTGMYFIRFQSGNRQYTRKIMKQ